MASYSLLHNYTVHSETEYHSLYQVTNYFPWAKIPHNAAVIGCWSNKGVRMFRMTIFITTFTIDPHSGPSPGITFMRMSNMVQITAHNCIN